ncbi:hypothetical protein BC833DRAFT_610415 [Globomyces pollinis-pini]|nr:hypothetical protein BC833DRAFT_610415 [Globomyces pollinis-pini]
MEDLSEVQVAVKEAFSIDVGFGLIQLYDIQGQLITDLDDIPEDSCKKVKDGGLFLVVHGLSGSRPSKRARSASSVASRASNSTELNQDSFRERILARDTNGCVLTGKDEVECQACHIVPWVYFQKYDLVGQEIWNSLFPFSCFNPTHQVMDVRNGILMWGPLNAQFYKFAFTIIKKGSIYEVEALREDEMETPKKRSAKSLQITVAKLDGKQFKFDNDKQDTWPGEKFLQLHNRIFHKKREANRLKAQVEVQKMSEEDSSQTTADEREESIVKVKNWDALFS